MTKPSFSAALLVGGRSTRMGRDKALLSLPGSGLVLWQNQLALLESLHPKEIFWSGHERPGLPAHLRIVADEVQNAGPLAGLAACLYHAKTDLLVVLAIDLPQMTSAFLQRLLSRCTSTRGSAIRQATHLEPLAAIYPKRLGAIAESHLNSGHYSLHELLEEAIKQEMMEAYPISEDDLRLFQNWNSPADLTS